MRDQKIFETADGTIQLWRFDYGNTRPSFAVVHSNGLEHFPAYDDPHNVDSALACVKALRAEYEADKPVNWEPLVVALGVTVHKLHEALWDAAHDLNRELVYTSVTGTELSGDRLAEIVARIIVALT